MSEIEKLISAECAELNSTVIWQVATERFQLLHAAFTRVADAAVQGERERICDWLDGRAKNYEPSSSSLVLELASKAIRSEHD